MNAPPFPRRLLRASLRSLGRLALPPLTRLELNDLDLFPEEGPLIVVGNHTGVMEVALLTVYARQPLEFLGSGDIPHEFGIAALIHLYGHIPVQRGQASRASLEKALDVLRRGGFLALFPQGGIWESGIQRVQTGVAWLSYRGRAPVLPVGFSSTRGALEKILRLKRPELTMSVGRPLPAVELGDGSSRKEQLRSAAQEIMEAVWSLVPAEDRPAAITPEDEHFAFKLTATDRAGRERPLPEELSLRHGPSLSKFLHRQTLFANLKDNLGLPIAPLRQLHKRPAPETLRRGTSAILGYLEDQNPHYFTYRYGPREGAAMEAAIRELDQALAWAVDHRLRVEGTAVRRYTDPETGEKVAETRLKSEAKL